MSATPTIRASVFTPILAKLQNDGVKTQDLLATHGLLSDHLADPYAVAPLARYLAFFEDAAKLSRTQCFGALLATAVTPGDLGPTGLLFSISPTILDAIGRLTRSISAIQGATSCGITETEDEIVWSYQLSSPKLWPRRQDSEFTLSVCCQIIRLSFARSWNPLEVHLEHPQPDNTAALSRVFRAPLKFGQSSNRLIIRKEDARRVYRPEDHALKMVLEHHIEDLAHKEAGLQTIRDRVCSLIATNLGYRRISITTLAHDLDMAPRTLQRRLQQEGTSLRHLIEQQRRELAGHFTETTLRKRDIADTLGYADATVFWRARQRWLKTD